jgi:TonB family protein
MRLALLLPRDRTRRALLVGLACSVLLHLALLGSLVVFRTLAPPLHVKRGEALFVDIAPDKPEEKAPLGNPARPLGPERAESVPPKAPPAPRPKLAEAPRPAAPKPVPPARPAPEPPKQIAKAEPPPAPAEPGPAPRVPEPAPAAPAPKPVAPEPQAAPPAAEAERARTEPAPAPAQQAPAGQEPQARTALARPHPDVAAGIFRQPPGGGGGLLGGRGGVEGEPIPLDTPEPRYQDYFNRIRERIKANWIYPREAGERGIQGDLLIEFHIAKDGRLQHLELRRSSGEEILDRFAMNAVRLAQPFPPVPDEIARQVLAINGLFRYQIVSGFVNQFLR